MMLTRMNPYRHHAPPGWSDMSSAPRDGTWIEIQNNWGVAPWFGKFRWTNERTARTQDGERHTFVSTQYGWLDDSGRGVSDGAHLSWRPCEQTGVYSDPTFGAQDTRAYWLRAAGFNPADYDAVDGESFSAEDKRRHGDKPNDATAEASRTSPAAPSSIAVALAVSLTAVILVAIVLIAT